jgi:Uma2 family endonuclease
MTATQALVSLDEYLRTAYEPDRDFVDGVLVERNVGTQRHALLQMTVGAFFWKLRKSHRISVFPECRLRVDAPTGRHRIPDVMVLEAPYSKGKVVVDVPAIIVEIKSPDDTFDDLVDRCFDYEKLGVLNIIVMDPDKQRAWLFRQGTLQLLSGGTIRLNLFRQELGIDFPFEQLFAEIDSE